MNGSLYKKLSGILIFPMLLATGFTFLAWINNCWIAVIWTIKAFKGEFRVSPDQVNADIPGIMRMFDWAAVDYSTASTFIVFFGLAMITVGLIRITFFSDGKRPPNDFPFFVLNDKFSYDDFTIILGLIGTVWGLIMIGYYSNPKIEDMTHCLHTALYSTLLAFVWVPMMKPVKWLMRNWYSAASGVGTAKVTGNSSALMDLVTQAARASGEVRTLGERFSVLSSWINNVSAGLLDFKKYLDEFRGANGPAVLTSINTAAQSLERTATAMNTVLASLVQETAARKLAMEALARESEARATAIKSMQTSAEKSVETWAQAQRVLTALGSESQKRNEAVAGFGEIQKSLTTAVSQCQQSNELVVRAITASTTARVAAETKLKRVFAALADGAGEGDGEFRQPEHTGRRG